MRSSPKGVQAMPTRGSGPFPGFLMKPVLTPTDKAAGLVVVGLSTRWRSYRTPRFRVRLRRKRHSSWKKPLVSNQVGLVAGPEVLKPPNAWGEETSVGTRWATQLRLRPKASRVLKVKLPEKLPGKKLPI